MPVYLSARAGWAAVMCTSASTSSTAATSCGCIDSMSASAPPFGARMLRQKL